MQRLKLYSRRLHFDGAPVEVNGSERISSSCRWLLKFLARGDSNNHYLQVMDSAGVVNGFSGGRKMIDLHKAAAIGPLTLASAKVRRRRLPRPVRFAFIGVALTLAYSAAVPAKADTVYSYTGNNFNAASYFYIPAYLDLGSNGFISGSFTVSSPLAANLSLTDITSTLLSYSFSNAPAGFHGEGAGELSSSTPLSYVDFKVSTDSSGNISNWAIILSNEGKPDFFGGQERFSFSTFNDPGTFVVDGSEYVSCTLSASSTCPNSSDMTTVTGYDLSVSNDPGTWVESTALTPTPLPGSLVLFSSGFGVLGLFGWRWKRKAKLAA